MAKGNRGGAGTRAVADTTSFEDSDRATRHQKSDLFSAQIVKSLFDSLPEPVCARRRQILPKILREWSRADLQKHLSLESPATVRERIKTLELVQKRARELSQALIVVDLNGRLLIVSEMLRAEGRSSENVSRTEWSNLRRRLDEQPDFLTKLAKIAPREALKPKRGGPRNFAAYLVLQDAAAIFEWFTGKKAVREVHRDYGTEIGPFFRFASVLWPVVFGRGVQGLPAAMKNWAQARSRYHEKSALIANVALRHATWRVNEC